MFSLLDTLALKAENLFGYVFGATCPACGRLGTSICNSCFGELVAGAKQPNKGQIEYHGTVLVAFEYNSAIRKMILNFKYRNQRSSLRFIGDALVKRIRVEQDRTLKSIGLVTWAPTTNKRIVERGYDHAELIAKYVAKQLSVPCRKVLFRVSNRPQTGKSREARLVGPTFSARKLDSEHLLLIDDVVTTGATLREALRAVNSQGFHAAGSVSAVTACVAQPLR